MEDWKVAVFMFATALIESQKSKDQSLEAGSKRFRSFLVENQNSPSILVGPTYAIRARARARAHCDFSILIKKERHL